jgi:hypothetical protein
MQSILARTGCWSQPISVERRKFGRDPLGTAQQHKQICTFCDFTVYVDLMLQSFFLVMYIYQTAQNFFLLLLLLINVLVFVFLMTLLEPLYVFIISQCLADD